MMNCTFTDLLNGHIVCHTRGWSAFRTPKSKNITLHMKWVLISFIPPLLWEKNTVNALIFYNSAAFLVRQKVAFLCSYAFRGQTKDFR